MRETCVDPAEIQEGDLMGYLDGMADHVIVQHIQRCPACSRQVAALASLQAILSVKLYRSSCPAPEQLVAYWQGQIKSNEKLLTVQHLRQCPHCARELAALARDERAGLSERLGAAIAKLEATLVMFPLKAVAVRGDEATRLTSQVYRAGEIEILLSLQPSQIQPTERDLSGLIHVEGHTPQGIGSATVELYRDNGLLAIAAVSPRGYFTFNDIELGRYDLSLLWSSRDILLREVQVK